MERVGLAARIEADLEKTISLGLLPEDGRLPSERALASHYRVARGTAREALVRLRSRGLIQVRHGTRARAVVMERVVRLENLGTALLAEGPKHPERHLLLEGYLELKRETAVELLAACCDKASEQELEKVRDACFQLDDAVRWEFKRPQWLALEFELLRQAALVAGRPGHFLLVQSLEQACRDMAGRVAPYLDSAALFPWTQCAMEALWNRDAEALRTRLPALLRASDERVLQSLAPSCEAYGVGTFLAARQQGTEVEAEAHSPLVRVPEVSEPTEDLPPSAQALEVGQAAPEPVPAGGMGAQCARWSSDCTSWCDVPPGGAPPAPALPGASLQPPHGVASPHGDCASTAARPGDFGGT